MGFGISGPHVFVKEPAEARFYCEVLAEKAAGGPYNYKQAYQALRSLSPQDLFKLYDAWRSDTNDGNGDFLKAFGPYYHQAAGEPVEGPLFEIGVDWSDPAMNDVQVEVRHHG